MTNQTHRNNNPFFHQDEHGHSIFYPWAYPGDGFYLELTQRKKVLAFCYSIYAFLCIFLLLSAYMHYEDIITITTFTYFLTTVTVITSIAYIFGVYKLSRKLTPYIKVDTLKVKRKVIMPWLFTFPVIMSMFEISTNFPISFGISLLCFAFCALYILGISYFLLSLQKFRGYLLTNRDSFDNLK